jgi:hypothetical protein
MMAGLYRVEIRKEHKPYTYSPPELIYEIHRTGEGVVAVGTNLVLMHRIVGLLNAQQFEVERSKSLVSPVLVNGTDP